MPRARQIPPFFLVVVDRNQKTFSVEGPMTDDTRWNSAVCRAQEAGREVNCFTSHTANCEQAAAEYAAEYGFRRVNHGTIVKPSFED
jgi:hypothetical protein